MNGYRVGRSEASLKNGEDHTQKSSEQSCGWPVVPEGHRCRGSVRVSEGSRTRLTLVVSTKASTTIQ